MLTLRCSTLLDLLADRKLDGRWSGAITIEGQPRTASFPQEIAYVLQDDLLIHNLTVEETLQYAAWVRMGDAVPVEKKQERVEELLQIMGLAHIRHSQVGNATVRGISGGQVKRLCIAVETISLPRLVFLDEPTSGLDSAMALEVMTVVRNFTTTQRTCLATVHQPSKAIFDLFDTVGILAAGRVVYFGPADKAVSYFTQPELGYTMKQKYKNPAEFLVEISCGQHLPEGFAKPRQPHELSRLFAASKFLSADVLEKSDSASAAVAPSTAVAAAPATAAPGALRYASSQWSQLQMLLSRTWTARVRDTADMSAQAIKSVAIGFLIGVVFYGCGEVSSPYFENGSQTSEVHAVNSLFLILVMTTMFMTVTAIPLLFAHVAVYRRELASGVYPPTPYWITQLLTSLPVQIAGNFLTTLMVYMLTQLPARGAYIVYFFLMNIALSVVSLASALAVTAFASTEQTALVLFPIQFMIMTLSAGYAITVDRMPVYWRWLMFIVYNRWAFEGLMINQWQDKDTDDDGGDNHGDILEDYSFDHFTKFGCIAVMALFYAFLALLVLYGLQPKKSKLQHVSAADLSALISTAKGPPRDRPVKGIVKDSGTSGKIRSLGAGNMGGGLKDSLLQNDQFSSDSEESNGDAVVGHTYKPTLTVESFRISSGVVETPKGCQLLFRDVAYSVPTKSDPVGEMQVLRGVTGRVSAGEMCALMGASGAGKSTLLDVLAKRKTSGRVTGEITYNGDSNMCTSAYVMQDNVHIDVLTVRETLYFAAQLRLSEQLSKPAKRARVQKILDILALNDVADSEVGSVDERGVSGGQLKRVSIGVEIVHLPDLMFLDEPTTGLDSAIALEVMSAIRNLANQNRTVVCTIHQPSADTFALFDTLLLLADGNVVYFGPTREAVPYFSNSPFAFAALQAGDNPADYIVHIANACEPTAAGAPESSDGSGGNRQAGDTKDVPDSSPAVTSASLALYYHSSAHHRIALNATDSVSLAAISNASLSPSPAASPTVNPLNIQQSAVETLDKTTPATAATGRKYNTSLTHQLTTLLERKFLVMSKKRRFYIMILLRYSSRCDPIVKVK
jgi:ABC-type multidrug transport system ATPase subunit